MKKKASGKVTIKNIADELGISFSTVAKALNNDPRVKSETRKLVQEKAAQVDYHPNVMAKGLRRKTTQTVGIILNDIENPTRTHIVKRILVDVGRHGYTTLIFDSMYDLETERKNIQAVLARIPDCVVISPVSIFSDNLSLLKDMLDRTVILSKIFEGVPANYVHMDHQRGGYIAATAMLNKGHRRNIIFAEPPDFPSSAQFLAGVRQAYEEYGVSYDEATLVHGTPSLEVGYKGICDLYEKNGETFSDHFTGVIAFCDLFAVGVYQAAAKLGLQIPEDLSVIGYDDYPLATLVSPPLTTIYMPKEQISSYCSEILLSKLVHNDPTVKSYSLQPHLVERNSIRKLD